MFITLLFPIYLSSFNFIIPYIIIIDCDYLVNDSESVIVKIM